MNKKNKKINLFYAGAENIANAIFIKENDAWTRPTLEAAIEHGEELMESDGRNCVIIVKIVRILRRAKNPIIIEKI